MTFDNLERTLCATICQKNQLDTCQNNRVMGCQSDYWSTNRNVLVHPGKFRAITRSGDIFRTNITYDNLERKQWATICQKNQLDICQNNRVTGCQSDTIASLDVSHVIVESVILVVGVCYLTRRSRDIYFLFDTSQNNRVMGCQSRNFNLPVQLGYFRSITRLVDIFRTNVLFDIL